MNKTVRKPILLILLFGVFLSQAVSVASSPAYAFSNQELDDLLAPIALYPDPLLAAMLPASTYPAEIADADAWLKRGGTVSGVDGQSWDEAVKAITYYPDILTMMAENLDWTADLGDAFLNQPEDVTRSIQRLRWRPKRQAIWKVTINSKSSSMGTTSRSSRFNQSICTFPSMIHPLYMTILGFPVRRPSSPMALVWKSGVG